MVDVLYEVVVIVWTEMGHGNILFKGFRYKVENSIIIVREGHSLFLHNSNNILWKRYGGIGLNEISEIVNEGHGFARMNIQRMSAEKVHEIAGTMANPFGNIVAI
jgi:hypothetical protein